MKKKELACMIEATVNSVVKKMGRFKIVEIRDLLKEQGYSFGNPEELVDFAERQKTRVMIGRLTDENGQKKYLSTNQPSLFGTSTENIFLPVESIKKSEERENSNLTWLKNHLVAIIRRTPLLPKWGIDEIIKTINQVFEKMRHAA